MTDPRLLERLKAIIRARESRPPASPEPTPRSEVSPAEWIPALARVLGLSSLDTGRGTVFHRQQCVPASFMYGSMRLEQSFSVASNYTILGQDDELRSFSPADAVFLDTETTGLAGGTGTCAFLVGVGCFSGDEFRISQLLMPDHSYEAAMLCYLATLIPSKRWIVSFNGKAFDIPLLEARYALNRIRPPFSSSLHFDLLHAARRLWRDCRECNLSSLERSVLGHEREDDIPGALIPGIFFDYLRNRDPEPLVRVIAHNRDDILAMVSLLGLMCKRLETPRETSQKALELVNLGRLFERAGLYERSATCYREIPNFEDSATVQRIATARLASLEKRRGNLDQAACLWRTLADLDPLSIRARIETAKYLEHKMKDYAGALKECEAAISARRLLLERARQDQDRLLESLLHRRERLLAKTGRTAASSLGHNSSAFH